MHPISLIFLGLCAFLVGFWLVRQLERRKVKSSGPQAIIPKTSSASAKAAHASEAKRATASSRTDRAIAPHAPFPSPGSTDTHQESAPAANYDIRDLILANRQAEAVKILHEQKGWDLAYAQEYVTQQAQRQSSKDLDPEVIAEARQLLAQHRKVSAVKLIYDHTGWSLKAAKDYVENSL